MHLRYDEAAYLFISFLFGGQKVKACVKEEDEETYIDCSVVSFIAFL